MRWPVIAAALLAAVLVAAACSGSSDVDGDSSAESATSSSTSTSPASTSSSSTSVAVAGTGAPGDVEELWAALWAAAVLEADVRDAAFAELGDSVSPDLVDTLQGLFQGEIERTVVNHPVLTENSDGSVKIDDCLHLLPAAIDESANWFVGKAVPRDDGGWIIEEAGLISSAGCVPQAIADEVLADYEEFWDARMEYWNPADPDHPLVAQTMTGGELERMNELLIEDRDNGWYVVLGGEVRHPEINAYSPTEVLVIDCQQSAPDTGVFDANGVRQEGIPETVPGQLDVNEVTLSLEGGQWKVSEIIQITGVECDFAPTEEFGIPIV